MMLFTKQRETVFPKIRQHRELLTEDTDEEKGFRDHKSIGVGNPETSR